jgi:uridine kinase
MIGDKLVITDYHRAGAAKAMVSVRERLKDGRRPLGVTVAGESGSGKSEIAHCLSELMAAEGLRSVVLGQDDYFVLPPKANHRKRLEDISAVGTGEVRLDLLDEHMAALMAHPTRPLEKPLVFFDEDRIGSETVEPGPLDAVIAEGTYTTLLKNADLRIFINRTYKQTKKARLTRGRDPDVGFLEKVLEIEHKEISAHRAKADVILDPPPEER